MSSEILAVLEYMEKEKGISRDDMIATIEGAVKAAAERGVNKQGEVRVEINPKTGAMQAWTRLEVVESVSDTATEIHVDKARLYADNPQVGDFVERELDPAYLEELLRGRQSKLLSKDFVNLRKNTSTMNFVIKLVV